MLYKLVTKTPRPGHPGLFNHHVTFRFEIPRYLNQLTNAVHGALIEGWKITIEPIPDKPVREKPTASAPTKRLKKRRARAADSMRYGPTAAERTKR